MIRFFTYVFVGLATTMSFAQSQLITKDNTSVPCRVMSVSSQLIRYMNQFNDQPDSIATEMVKEIRYGDTLRVLVVPMAEQGVVHPILSADFATALQQEDFVKLLHSRIMLPNLTFVENKAKTAFTLTTTSKNRLTTWLAPLKGNATLSAKLTVHTDSAGRSVVNQSISDRQATAVRAYLAASGFPAARFEVSGLGETQPISAKPELNRRIELQCTNIKGIQLLYSETYIPPKKPEPVVAKTETTVLNTEQYITPKNQYSAPKKIKPIGIVIYGEALYTLESLSKTWVNADEGIGILQGFGGGLLATYYVSPNFGLTFQGGYSQWQVQRRYMTEEKEVIYTNDQKLQRIGAQIGVRLYAFQTAYLQAMGGGHMLTLNVQNSDLHPDGTEKTKTQAFQPTAGAALGFEIGKGALIDVAAQYQLSFNKDFAGATDLLHYVGLRVGVGFRSRSR